MKSFRHTVATPRKWSGPMGAFEAARQLLDVDPGLEAGRVDLVRHRGEEHVGAGTCGDFRIPFLVPGVRVEIGRFVELRRVDEDADDDRVAFGTAPRR